MLSENWDPEVWVGHSYFSLRYSILQARTELVVKSNIKSLVVFDIKFISCVIVNCKYNYLHMF